MLKFHKPTYFWMSMLDLNKVLIYEFYYDYMKKKYGKNSRILFFNTDNSKY